MNYPGQDFFVFISIFFVLLTIILYASEKSTIALKSILILTSILLFFTFFPYLDGDGNNLLGPSVILNGFSNTSLIAVICLLILGQGVVQTRVLDNFISRLINFFPGKTYLIFIISLLFVLFLSAFLNNTPVVIIFIPIMQSIANRTNSSVSKYMMPLSFAAILGGMMTLIGSSTNLLVSNSLTEIKGISISFFEFFVPGLVIAFFGLVYIFIFSRYLLKDNAPMATELIGSTGKQFITQITLSSDSVLIGESINTNIFENSKDISILMVQRGEHGEFSPYVNYKLKKKDILIITTTREALSELLSKDLGLKVHDSSILENNLKNEQEQILSEAMVTPSSSLVGQTIENVSFRYRFDSIVIGLQRRSRMIRNRITEIPLEPGDVLLVQGSRDSIKNLRTQSDIMPMEWTSSEIVKKDSANKSLIIFLGVILLSAFELLPIVVSSVFGVLGMLFSRVLTLSQATRAIDNNLLLLVVTSLALGNIIQTTGTAMYFSDILFGLLNNSSPTIILSCFFIFVSIATNFISNNACAVLFTPIAIDLAEKVNIDPKIFAISVIFAVNTSFLTPLAYQTNLLVMGPGHYKFFDFIKFGLPLTFVCWLSFSIFVPWYYNL